jgi:hypothetical protein
MAKPLLLSIGEKLQMEPHPASAADSPAAPPQTTGAEVSGGPAPESAAPPSAESLAQIYDILKRHQETLRDLIVEIRLLYRHLPPKEQQRLEAQREPTTREVGDLCAAQLHELDETIARLRGKQ